ncbi:hypothetical protein B5M09_008398 [Aphanomyces astaci]|uniref:C1q domain-containing protein n=1 Tax=Aphanomyces astaci TaxID=112090 RepID=A0A425C0I3_APHAT|nr:hypothetical protein B5M09_008398 [Aphanomyces astaci]
MPPSAGLHGLTHLLAGDTEWRNIQTIVKTTLQAVAKIVSSHAVMLDTMDARIDRMQDAAFTALAPPPHISNNDDDASMVVSRKEFLALVADVRKLKKRSVSPDDLEARAVASGNELKRRLDHAITPLQDTIRDMEEVLLKQFMAHANSSFASNEALRHVQDDVTERYAAKMSKIEQHMATKGDLHALEQRVMTDTKAQHRAQALQVKDTIGHLEKGLRKHLADQLAHEHVQHADGWTEALEDLRSKVVVKDACTLLDTKCNVVDVNDALGALQQTIHTKADEGDLQALVEDLTGLRKQMRGELCVGRWIWKTGRPTDRHTIAWTVQVVNTNPDVFAWDKGSDHVTAIIPGLYQLQASFFTDYAPTLQVLVNGEPALVLSGYAITSYRTCAKRG